MRTTNALEETATRIIASVVGGSILEDAPGGKTASANPARSDETVAEVLLGDSATFVEACRPGGQQGRRALRQQLHERRGGAPALRWQRQERPPFGHLDHRPVHPLAVDEFGLHREVPEGLDGRRKPPRRPQLHAPGLTVGMAPAARDEE